MIKKLLKMFAYGLGFLLVCITGLAVYLIEPWIVATEVRTTGKLETIRADYARACGEEFLTEYGSDESNRGRLALVLPEGGISPEDTPAAQPENTFVITGYRYKTLRRNVFSGKVAETPGSRFDVVAWHVVLPYRIFRAYDYEQVNTPLGWKTASPEPTFAASATSAHSGC